MSSRNAVWDRRMERTPRADEVVIGELGLLKGQRILYLYGFGDEIRLDVRVDDILQEDAPPLSPMIVEQRGEPPEPYSDWE